MAREVANAAGESSQNSHKRPRSSPGQDNKAKRPEKVADFKSARDRHVKDLEAQIKELQKFIIGKGLENEIPSSIRRRLESSPDFAKQVRERIDKAIMSEHLRHRKLESPYAGDLCASLIPYLEDIEQLSKRPGGLEEAIGAVVNLGALSILHSCDSSEGQGSRPSDRPADVLLCRLAEKMKDEQPGWIIPKKQFEKIREGRREMGQRGIDSYFPESVELFSSWATNDKLGIRSESL